ncbi:hypothetical protein REH65_32655 [Saccharopolyspora sp. ID03-671]|uniref:hypothetical protein n=1 Tax=Saccharopolyspora sp. ID03-671 TaxID=3073066 RepID=UPI003251E732
MSAAFIPPLFTATAPSATGHTSLGDVIARAAPLLLSAALLAVGQVIVFPFEMDTIVTLTGNRLVATYYYGLYNTVCGVGIMLGNLLTRSALDAARTSGVAMLPWVAMIVIGLFCAAGISTLDRAQRLSLQPAVAAG